MPSPIVFYISGHGFGHASRVVEVINTLKERRRDLPIIVRTSAARGLFELTLRQRVDFHEIECDTGVVQIDSLHLDEAASIRRAAEFHRDLDDKAQREAAFLHASRARLVVGDIPPLAFAAAAAAGIPAIALANFTWDWIYEGYPEQLATAPDLVPTLRRAYACASLALRLPMAGGFAAMQQVTRDIPLIARRSRRDPADVRKALGLPEHKPLVLLSFGGYGLAGLDTRPLVKLANYTVVLTDTPSALADELEPAGARSAEGSLVRLSDRHMYQAGYRYEDLVRAADVVVTKPGYGIVAEAIANETAILYSSRGRFVEYEVLVHAMPRFARCLFISQEDLLAGRWGPYLEQLLHQPPPAEMAATDGAQVAANAMLDYLF